MPKACDNKSVGILAERDGRILLIERAKFPPGFAIPAGHVDEDLDFETAGKRELKEEVGLNVSEIKLIHEGREENPCRREGGLWHYWKIYSAEISGDVNRSLEETKQAKWFSKEEIEELASRTKEYKAGNISEEDWAANPGLEPVMYDLFLKLKIV